MNTKNKNEKNYKNYVKHKTTERHNVVNSIDIPVICANGNQEFKNVLERC